MGDVPLIEGYQARPKMRYSQSYHRPLLLFPTSAAIEALIDRPLMRLPPDPLRPLL